MATPTYEVQRIDDHYVPVLKGPNRALHRAAYLAGGALLGYMGLVRRGWLGSFALVSGGALLVRGMTGCDPLAGCCSTFNRASRNGPPSQAPSYAHDESGRAPQAPSDLVDEQSMESFPASDAPARTGVSL